MRRSRPNRSTGRRWEVSHHQHKMTFCLLAWVWAMDGHQPNSPSPWTSWLAPTVGRGFKACQTAPPVTPHVLPQFPENCSLERTQGGSFAKRNRLLIDSHCQCRFYLPMVFESGSHPPVPGSSAKVSERGGNCQRRSSVVFGFVRNGGPLVGKKGRSGVLGAGLRQEGCGPCCLAWGGVWGSYLSWFSPGH